MKSACQPLIEIAVPELYRNNPFHILRLPTDATPKQIAHRKEDIEAAFEMGTEKNEFFTYDGMTIPDKYRVAELFRELEDPERRLIWEFFWFWPIEGSEHDVCVKAIKDHGVEALDEAMSNWRALTSTSNPIDICAQHNLAIACHFQSLEGEFSLLKTKAPTAVMVHLLNQSWEQGYELWNNVLGYQAAQPDLFHEALPIWNAVSRRIKKYGDPRIRHDYMDVLGDIVPSIIVAVNVELAKRFAKEDNTRGVRRQRKVIQQFGSELIVRKITTDTLNKVKIELDRLVDAVKTQVSEDHRLGLTQARSAVLGSRTGRNLITDFFGCDGEVEVGLLDNLAETVYECLRSYIHDDPDDKFSLAELREGLNMLVAAHEWTCNRRIRNDIEHRITDYEQRVMLANEPPRVAPQYSKDAVYVGARVRSEPPSQVVASPPPGVAPQYKKDAVHVGARVRPEPSPRTMPSPPPGVAPKYRRDAVHVGVREHPQPEPKPVHEHHGPTPTWLSRHGAVLLFGALLALLIVLIACICYGTVLRLKRNDTTTSQTPGTHVTAVQHSTRRLAVPERTVPARNMSLAPHQSPISAAEQKYEAQTTINGSADSPSPMASPREVTHEVLPIKSGTVVGGVKECKESKVIGADTIKSDGLDRRKDSRPKVDIRPYIVATNVGVSITNVPTNGSAWVSKTIGQCVAPLRIETYPGDGHHVIALVDQARNRVVMKVFIRDGEATAFKMPKGSYSLWYSCGQEWHASNLSFGTSAPRQWIKTKLSFGEQPEGYSGYKIRLGLNAPGQPGETVAPILVPKEMDPGSGRP